MVSSWWRWEERGAREKEERRTMSKMNNPPRKENRPKKMNVPYGIAVRMLGVTYQRRFRWVYCFMTYADQNVLGRQ